MLTWANFNLRRLLHTPKRGLATGRLGALTCLSKSGHSLLRASMGPGRGPGRQSALQVQVASGPPAWARPVASARAAPAWNRNRARPTCRRRRAKSGPGPPAAASALNISSDRRTSATAYCGAPGRGATDDARAPGRGYMRSRAPGPGRQNTSLHGTGHYQCGHEAPTRSHHQRWTLSQVRSGSQR